jgi:hypothetical protein
MLCWVVFRFYGVSQDTALKPFPQHHHNTERRQTIDESTTAKGARTIVLSFPSQKLSDYEHQFHYSFLPLMTTAACVGSF